jgi:hypothetical protein
MQYDLRPHSRSTVMKEITDGENINVVTNHVQFNDDISYSFIFFVNTELEFLNSLWGLGTEEE